MYTGRTAAYGIKFEVTWFTMSNDSHVLVVFMDDTFSCACLVLSLGLFGL